MFICGVADGLCCCYLSLGLVFVVVAPALPGVVVPILDSLSATVVLPMPSEDPREVGVLLEPPHP